MGIDSLNKYLQQNGKEMLIELLLSGKVIITEKINAHRVSILKDRLNNVEFYAKKKSTHIRTIDRIISDLYEPFMHHIISVKDKLSQGTYNFYFVNHDLDVKYTKKPKNSLLLTDMSFPKSKTKIAKKDLPTIQDVSSLIETDYQKTVFEGKLMKRKHIKHIVDYIENGGNLPEIMTNIFGEQATCLSKKSGDIIEGYIFRFDDKLFKLEDNRFKRKTYPKTNTSGYEMLIVELHEFVKSLDFTEIKLDVKNKDLKYAKFIFEVFNKYIDYWGDDIERHLINPPSFMSSTGNLGKRYITNKETLKYLKDERYEYLLRVFLTSFYRPINKRGLLDDDFVKQHKILTKKIQEYINLDNSVLDFHQFKKFMNG